MMEISWCASTNEITLPTGDDPVDINIVHSAEWCATGIGTNDIGTTWHNLHPAVPVTASPTSSECGHEITLPDQSDPGASVTGSPAKRVVCQSDDGHREDHEARGADPSGEHHWHLRWREAPRP